VFSGKDSPKALQLTGEKMEFQEFFVPRHIQVTKDYLIVAENANTDILYVSSKKDRSFVKKLGKYGIQAICRDILPCDERDHYSILLHVYSQK
jgi:lipid II:glycine glycyltransferase (peptidoglycan interpeptide bridge formation enzyme)